MKNIDFTSEEQLDGDGKVVDKIFKIVETNETKKVRVFSGKEINEKIAVLDGQIKKLTDELNFYKTIIDG